MQIIRLSQTRDPFKQKYPHMLQCRILPTLLLKSSIFQKSLKEEQTTTITWNSWWEFEAPEFRKTFLLRLEEWPTGDTKTRDLRGSFSFGCSLKKPGYIVINKFVCLWFSNLSRDSLYCYAFAFYSEYHFSYISPAHSSHGDSQNIR